MPEILAASRELPYNRRRGLSMTTLILLNLAAYVVAYWAAHAVANWR